MPCAVDLTFTVAECSRNLDMKRPASVLKARDRELFPRALATCGEDSKRKQDISFYIVFFWIGFFLSFEISISNWLTAPSLQSNL